MFKIKACKVVFPDRLVGNAEVLDIVRGVNVSLEPPQLDRVLTKVAKFFEYSGIQSRRWLSALDSSLPLIVRAVESALRHADVPKDEVGMIIFAGIDRKLIEPGFSFYLGKKLGLANVQCFDVLEACNGWVRAVDIASNYFRGGYKRKILIVTAEFLCHEGELVHKSFQIDQPEDLAWSMASMTLGESATATLLEADPDGVWEGEIVAVPEYSDLCYSFLDAESLNLYRFENGPADVSGKFVSYAQNMNQVGFPIMCELMAKHKDRLLQAQLCLPHSHSVRCWEKIARTLEVRLPFYFLFPQYGNLATSSLPAALALAHEERAIKRGDRFSITTAAAGMSFAVFNSVL
jgi:acyl-CoA:acyl-CoA alkyltransferase